MAAAETGGRDRARVAGVRTGAGAEAPGAEARADVRVDGDCSEQGGGDSGNGMTASAVDGVEPDPDGVRLSVEDADVAIESEL